MNRPQYKARCLSIVFELIVVSSVFPDYQIDHHRIYGFWPGLLTMHQFSYPLCPSQDSLSPDRGMSLLSPPDHSPARRTRRRSIALSPTRNRPSSNPHRLAANHIAQHHTHSPCHPKGGSEFNIGSSGLLAGSSSALGHVLAA
ncbi:hypothetical protein CaCOL14_005747 [Colletotrichum acutatum]